MKNTIFLHVGFHKTGTSSIQHFLSYETSFLKSIGLRYPSSVRHGTSHNILANSLKNAFKTIAPNPHYIKLKKEIAKHTENIILSSECFMEGLDPEIVKNNIKYLNCDVKIIIYVRPQIQWVESLYGEIIKDSNRRYTGYIAHMREVRLGRLNYFKVIKNWQNTFGENCTIVREFKKWDSKMGLIVDFLDTIASSTYTLNPKDKQTTVVNQGFDPRCLEFLRRINKVAMPREMHIQTVLELQKLSHKITPALGDCTLRLISQDEIQQLNQDWNADGTLNDQILSSDDTLPFNNEPLTNFPEKRETLTASEEIWIFDRLPKAIQEHLSKMVNRIKERRPCRSFIPPSPTNEVDRLRAEVNRLRVELSWIYS